MGRERFHTTPEQDRELQQAFMNTQDGATRTRYQAVRLYGSQYRVEEILAITGCSRTSLMDWCRLYRAGGIKALVDHRSGGNRAKLTREQITDLTERLNSYCPRDILGWKSATSSGTHWTLPDLVQAVESWYGVRWDSLTSYRSLFARCGFSYQRSEGVYKSRCEVDVAEFAEQVEKNSSISPKRHPIPLF